MMVTAEIKKKQKTSHGISSQSNELNRRTRLLISLSYPILFHSIFDSNVPSICLDPPSVPNPSGPVCLVGAITTPRVHDHGIDMCM